MNQAVDGTAGRVLTFDGGLASTVYSASAGGVTALPSEGFGTDSSDYPYLVSTPYLTKDPVRWTQSIPLADLGTRFGYRGEVTDATVSAAGPSGRALEVTIAGDSGPMVVPVLTFASRLDLQSTLFSLRPGEGAVRRSPVPQVPRPVQAQPDEVATLRPLAILPEPARHTPDKVRVSCALLAVAVAAAHESRRRQRARASARSTGI